jgi:endoglucanase Acf2
MQSPSNLPDPEICRTRLVYEELWECLVKYAFRCPHSIRFGNGYYCDHPERNGYNLKNCDHPSRQYPINS